MLAYSIYAISKLRFIAAITDIPTAFVRDTEVALQLSVVARFSFSKAMVYRAKDVGFRSQAFCLQAVAITSRAKLALQYIDLDVLLARVEEARQHDDAALATLPLHALALARQVCLAQVGQCARLPIGRRRSHGA